MIFDKNFLKEKILKKLSILDEQNESKIIIQNPQNVIIKNNDTSSEKYEDEEENQKIKTYDSSSSNEVPVYDDETEVLDLASDASVDDDKSVDIPDPVPDPDEDISYEDEEEYEYDGPSVPTEPSEQDINQIASDSNINDDDTRQISNMIPSSSMLNPNVNSYEDEETIVNAVAASPENNMNNGQEPYYNDEEQLDPSQGTIDPNTGMPVQSPQIDPVTGMPIPAPGTIDPVTGMPLDPNSDEMNPEMTIGNSSEVVKGAPVPLEDLSRIEELKNINSQLMQIRQILEKELNNKYNKVEDKVIEAVNYFRSIISNLDSFSTQIDDIIFKYKRFILAVLTEINIIKELEIAEINGSDNSKDKNKKSDKTDTKK